MPAFKPMLARDADPSVLVYPLAVQAKLDGIRCSIVGGKALSRTLKEIPNREIFEALSRPEFEGLDGEIIVGAATAEDCYRKTASFVMAPNKAMAEWTFRVFDKWDAEGGFLVRLAGADGILGLHTSARIVRVGSILVNNSSQLEQVEAGMVEKGYEGVIVRTLTDPYKFGRSGKKGPLLKIKRFTDSEAVILDTVEEMHNGNERVTNELGRGQRSSAKAGKTGKGSLGKLVVRDLYSGVEFSIGTGFTAADRASLWADRESLPGRTLKYKHFLVGAKDKPRHPVMLGFREGADLPETEATT